MEYFVYYIGYKTKSNKVRLLGPFDYRGKIIPALIKSRSFASELFREFRQLPEKMYSADLRKTFKHHELDYYNLMYLPYTELPDLPSTKKGYFLIEDVQYFEETGDYEDRFYDYLPPLVYDAKAKNELKFGMPPTQYDCEGNPFENHSASEYMYYEFMDPREEGYEVGKIRELTEWLLHHYDYEIKKEDIVILFRHE